MDILEQPEEELEKTEPLVTSYDPNERKLARRLRIERRLEAIKRYASYNFFTSPIIVVSGRTCLKAKKRKYQ